MAEVNEKKEGWGMPGRSNKFHYFDGSMSLCRKWGFYFGPLDPDDGKESSDDCKTCRNELKKRAALKENPGVGKEGE